MRVSVSSRHHGVLRLAAAPRLARSGRLSSRWWRSTGGEGDGYRWASTRHRRSRRRMGDERSGWLDGRARRRSGWTSGRRGGGRPAALLHGCHEHLYDGGIADQGDDPKPALTPGAAQSIDVPYPPQQVRPRHPCGPHWSHRMACLLLARRSRHDPLAQPVIRRENPMEAARFGSRERDQSHQAGDERLWREQ